MIFISNHIGWNLSQIYYVLIMKTYRCYKCGLTIPVSCSKCDRVVNIKIIGEGCLVKENKCLDCTDVPIIKDVCLEKTT